jgi:hypothetical protein
MTSFFPLITDSTLETISPKARENDFAVIFPTV